MGLFSKLRGTDRPPEVERAVSELEGRLPDGWRFVEFRKDPLATVASLYDALGLTLTADAEARMRTFLDAHPGDPDNALRRYSFADTGLDEPELRARVRDYQEHFAIESEPLGT